MVQEKKQIAKFHLPGLFEFYEFYQSFLPLFQEHRDWFYDWCEIASLYGAPEDCIWGGGRFGEGNVTPEEVLELVGGYGISARLTFSNSLIQKCHLSDLKCNQICQAFEGFGIVQNGVIVHSDILLEYLKKQYPGLYLVSSTTKVLTEFEALKRELERDEFAYVVPDFRWNKSLEQLVQLPQSEKDKVEFLCNECCSVHCTDRRACYENVSRRILEAFEGDFQGDRENEKDSLDDNVGFTREHICRAPGGREGYRFSKAMSSPMFIGIEDIQKVYLPAGFSNFKIEGRGLGSAVLLEFLLYYLTKPEYQLQVREHIYLDSMLDLF